MFRKITSLVLISVLLISLSGCATILKEKETQIKVDSEPQGAEVYLTKLMRRGKYQEVRLGRTPTIITLDNRRDVALNFKKSGYEESNYTVKSDLAGGWMLTSFVCLIMPAFIDLVTKNARSFRENEIKVTLDPVLPKQAEQINTKK